MKRVLSCLVLAACGSKPTPVTPPPAVAHPADAAPVKPTGPAAATTAEARAKLVVDDLIVGKLSELRPMLSAEVAAALPEPDMAKMWGEVEAQLGKIDRCDTPAKLESKPGQPTVYAVPCHFAKAGVMDWLVALDDKQQVVGLHLGTPHSTEPWQAPAYAAKDATSRDLAVGDLPGTLTVPAGKGPVPCVVLVHGSGPHDRDETVGPNKPFADLALGLAAHGIATLRYEKRTKAKPGSLPKDLTVNEETVNDAVIAADLCAAQPEIDHKRVFVLGHSLGAWVAPRIAKHAKDLAGLIILAGPTRDLADIIVDQITYIANADGTVSPDEQKAIDDAKADAKRIHELEAGAAPKPDEMHVFAPASYWKDLAGYDAPKLAATLKLRIFVGQGGRDYQVSATKDFPAWQKALAGKKGDKLVVWPKLTHLLTPGEGPSTPAEYEKPGQHVDEQVITDLADWITAK
ncbi:MAG: alpha/beta fold hydrolase [Deltaproteobacteria bacterium]|nr:alpha/beta fold hydrolase [Deltaproteobacteria bacterium]